MKVMMDLKKRPSEGKSIHGEITKHLEKGKKKVKDGVDLLSMTKELAKRRVQSNIEDENEE